MIELHLSVPVIRKSAIGKRIETTLQVHKRLAAGGSYEAVSGRNAPLKIEDAEPDRVFDDGISDRQTRSGIDLNGC